MLSPAQSIAGGAERTDGSYASTPQRQDAACTERAQRKGPTDRWVERARLGCSATGSAIVTPFPRPDTTVPRRR